MKKNRNSILLGAALLLLLLSGCSKPPEPPPAPKAAPQAKPPQPVLPVQKQLSSAAAGRGALDFRKRTDPFKPYAPIAAAPVRTEQQGARPPAADLLPIQTFEVSKFKVAGIIAGLKENRALLIDPNGKGYVVEQGMVIGGNNGRISRITAASVEVTESFKDDSGRIKKRKIVLTLAKKR